MLNVQTVGLRMKWIVEHLFENKLEACFRLNVASPGQLSKYFVEEVHPSAKVLIAAVNFGVSADWILTGIGTIWVNTPEGELVLLRLRKDFQQGRLRVDDLPEGSRHAVEAGEMPLDIANSRPRSPD